MQPEGVQRVGVALEAGKPNLLLVRSLRWTELTLDFQDACDHPSPAEALAGSSDEALLVASLSGRLTSSAPDAGLPADAIEHLAEVLQTVTAVVLGGCFSGNRMPTGACHLSQAEAECSLELGER